MNHSKRIKPAIHLSKRIPGVGKSVDWKQNVEAN